MADHASAGGGLALWGTSWEGEGAPAYWPWMQIIRSYARGRKTDELYADLGDGAADIARLVPEVGSRFLSLTAAAEVDPDQARFRLFDHISRFLASAAAKQPIVLILEDLHWSDRSSLTLMRFVAQALRAERVLLLGTYRDSEIAREHPFAEALGDLTRDRIVLGGLSNDGVARLIEATTGASPPRELAEAVFGRTTGNPFFVKEVARLLASQGRLDQAGAAASFVIPDGIRDVVLRRLARLSQECVDVLGAASVVGPEFEPDLVAGLTDRSVTDVVSLLATAESARVVAEIPGVIGRYSFAHALVREVIYDGLGAHRAELHRRAGEILEKRRAASGSGGLSEIANHYLKGATAGDALQAARMAIEAARESLRMFAWDQAAEFYARALEVMMLGAPEDDLRLRTLLELGDARTSAGDLEAARAVYGDAADLALALERPEELAHAALGFGSGLAGFEVRLFDDRQIELLWSALASLPENDTALGAWVLARLSVATSYLTPVEQRVTLSRQAVGMARRVGDNGALSYALSSLCDALAGPAHVDERIAASTEMIRLAAEPAAGAARCGVESCSVCLCSPEFALLGRRIRLVANLKAGDVAATDEDIEAYARLAEHLRQPLYLWYVPLFRGMRALMRGELNEAERLTSEAAAVASQTTSGNGDLLTLVQRAGEAWERGDPARVAALWREAIALSPETAALSSMRGMPIWMAAFAGNPVTVRPALERWAEAGGMATEADDAEWLDVAWYYAESAVRARESTAASSIYESLLPYEHLLIVEGIGARMIGSVAHLLGRLAAFLGRPGDAERHLERGLEAHTRAGATLWEARSKLELARLLRDIDDPNEDRRRELARSAAEAFTAAGSEAEAADALGLADGSTGTETEAKLEAEGNVFRREGEFWTVVFEGRLSRVKDSKGMRDIVTLLSTPSREVAALDLMGRDAGPGTSASGPKAEGLTAAGDAGELLDDRARAEYKSRIADLQLEIDDATADNDHSRAARAHQELEQLTEQLTAAYGLGGRARKAGDPAERARKAVTERIRDALGKIARDNPGLARHLKRSLRTGSFCVYSPEKPVTWSF